MREGGRYQQDKDGQATRVEGEAAVAYPKPQAAGEAAQPPKPAKQKGGSK